MCDTDVKTDGCAAAVAGALLMPPLLVLPHIAMAKESTPSIPTSCPPPSRLPHSAHSPHRPPHSAHSPHCLPHPPHHREVSSRLLPHNAVEMAAPPVRHGQLAHIPPHSHSHLGQTVGLSNAVKCWTR